MTNENQPPLTKLQSKALLWLHEQKDSKSSWNDCPFAKVIAKTLFDRGLIIYDPKFKFDNPYMTVAITALGALTAQEIQLTL